MQAPLIYFYNEKVKTGMDIFIRSGKIYDIQPTGTKEFKNAAIVIPGEEFTRSNIFSEKRIGRKTDDIYCINR